jgi:hypothetical protein
VTELLSVVIPTHDRPDRLEGAVRSVLDQDYPAVEVVIVDDGSGPATADVLDRLAGSHPRLVVVRHDDARGASAARNAGIAAATGELVGFCDDDDVWLPGAAAATVAALTPSTGMAYGFHQVHVEATGRIVTFRPPACTGPALLRWVNVPAILFGVARRSLLGDEFRFDPDLVLSEDWDLWLRCAELAPLTLVPAPVYRYVQHTGSRVTTGPTAHPGARRRFLAKHRSSMTPACIAHHELVAALTGRDLRAGLDQLGQVPRHPANLGSAALLAGELVTARIGPRRDDPGLTLRMAARALGPATRPRTGAADRSRSDPGQAR